MNACVDIWKYLLISLLKLFLASGFNFPLVEAYAFVALSAKIYE